MLEIISLVVLFCGFTLMTYNNYKEGHMGLAIFSAVVVVVNLIYIVQTIGGKF